MTIVKETKRKLEEDVVSHGVVEALDNLDICFSMKGERKTCVIIAVLPPNAIKPPTSFVHPFIHLIHALFITESLHGR